MDDGFCIELDRSLFKSYVAAKSGKSVPVLDNKLMIRTNLVHKDKSDPFKIKGKKEKENKENKAPSRWASNCIPINGGCYAKETKLL